MGKIYIKGGAWRNTEDEILKAAVMKYGKNQWARVASLLNRKSAKQCKARWNEWLDPSIKKTEWTREEEEKLLHLAKILPTQWRTIASIVGRTPFQCLEHYEKLLDQAQKREQGEGAEDDDSNDVRKLKIGDVDPHPESKPAKPDPIDMDEDEKEMLSEARARIANTLGKKAKRKAREKLLEEARRLATLQKKRELRAAGIRVNMPRVGSKWKQNIDYNEEIPFQKRAAPGFYDTSVEEEKTQELTKPSFVNFSLQNLEGRRKALEEQQQRKKDEQRIRNREKVDLPSVVKQVQKANEGETSGVKRSALQLPTPQVSEEELNTLGKITQQNEYIAEMARVESEASSSSSHLLSEYETNAFATNLKATPLRTPSLHQNGSDALLQSAQNLRMLNEMQTPLHGGKNIKLNDSFDDFSGATPSKRSVAATPNPLATPFLAKASTTRASASGVLPTPLRDGLHLNQESVDEVEEELDAKAQKKKLEANRKKLKMSLNNLPAPSSNNELDLSIPVPQSMDDQDELEEDREERDKRRELKKQNIRQSKLAKRSQSIQRKLPIPNYPSVNNNHLSKSIDPVQLIQQESIKLIQFDNILYKQYTENVTYTKREVEEMYFDEFTEKDLSSAKQLIKTELESITIPSYEIFKQVWEKTHAKQTIPLTILQSMKTELLQKNSKLESRLNLLMGGYKKRREMLHTEIQQLAQEVANAEQNKSSFTALYDLESQAIPKRIEALKEEVEQLELQEKELQTEYQRIVQT